MTTITIWKDGNKKSIVIKIKGINEVKDLYLKELGLTSIQDSSLENANKLFIRVIQDFKSGKLSIDELSTFGFEIFHGVAKKNKESDLFQASLSASELIFEIRSDGQNIQRCLRDINTFYEDNRI